MYIYPDNLKSKAVLWLWELRDIAIIGVGALISVFAMAQLGFLPPVVITAAYAFLSIRLEDTSILDFLRYAIRYFLLGQQTYAWGLCNPSTDRSSCATNPTTKTRLDTPLCASTYCSTRWKRDSGIAMASVRSFLLS